MAFIPRKIGNLAYVAKGRNDAYTKEGMRDVIENSELIAGLKTNTSEGLSAYVDMILGDENALDEASPDNIEKSRGYVLNNHLEHMVVNAGSLLNPVKDGLVKQALVYNPEAKLYKTTNNDSYNVVVTVVNDMHQAMRDAQDPSKQAGIVEKGVEGLNDASKDFFKINFADDVLKGYVVGKRETADERVEEYKTGVKGVAQTNVEVMDGLANEAPGKQKELAEKMEKVAKEKTEDLGRELTTREMIEIRESFADEAEKLAEKYGGVGQDLARYVNTAGQLWYQTEFPKKEESEEDSEDSE